MEREEWFCRNRACDGRLWEVSEDSDMPETWVLRHPARGTTWYISAQDPVCPQCGTTLVLLLELEGGFGELEQARGPVFDYLRGLPSPW